MASNLIVVHVEKLQEEINKLIKSKSGLPVIYVSLNKNYENMSKIFKDKNIDVKRLFFIDCVANEQSSEDVVNIKPTELAKLNLAISTFVKEIKGEKILVVDALSTLLIYNNENKVAQFVKNVTEYASQKDVEVIALSPKTEGEELLNKIFNFFNKVEKK